MSVLCTTGWSVWLLSCGYLYRAPGERKQRQQWENVEHSGIANKVAVEMILVVFEGSRCLASMNCSTPASFCSCSSAPMPSFVFIMSSLGSRLKAIGWILALVSVLGSAVVTSALASVGVSDEVPAVALFCFPHHLGFCSRTGKMTKGDSAGRSES